MSEGVSPPKTSETMVEPVLVYSLRQCAGVQCFVTEAIIAVKNIALVLHPSYLPNLAPCDFSLFLKIK
jgi:hypothetical protein